MKKRRMTLIAGIFALFQCIMPLIGWLCVHTMVEHFTKLEKFIPWIALILLCFIGGKMLMEGIKKKDEEEHCGSLGFGGLLIQGVATSIDALSVGFTTSDYDGIHAIICGLLIAAVTFPICFCGLYIGKKFGTHLAGKASILGGAILIFIGFEIFITGLF